MKVELLVSRVTHENGRIIPQQLGDIVTVTEAEGKAMIAKGQAIAVPEPKPKRTRRSNKQAEPKA
jgi:mannitol/fructose-specific phosphotransferase system IIA component (Ntr-type)